MSDTIRAFIAVKMPVLPKLHAVMRSLAAMGWPVAAVSPDNLHVTLKFLGDTPVARVEAIQREIASAVSGQAPFVLKVESLGAFPNADRPSVVWVGLLDAEPLNSLAERLQMSLTSLGFARESRPFQPHLTLARIKGRPSRELFDVLRRHADTHFGTVEIHLVELIRSELHREGAKYTVLSSQALSLQI